MSQGNARWGVGATGAPGPTGPPGPAGPPGAGASGAALFELAPVASPRFIGRFSAGSGVMQQLTPDQAASMLPPFFASGAQGIVIGPTGGVSGNFLRDDGTWAAAGAAGRPSGVTLGEQAVAPPLTVQGRFTLGTGTREDLAPGSVASLIGGGWGSGMQLLKAPTGGVQGRMLRDDGAWVQPSLVASGLAPAQLLPLSPLTVVGRFTAGSGTREELRGDQVASMIGKFAGTGLGLIPTPTGGTLGRMLRDDGQWTTPSFVASGVSFAQQRDISPQRFVGRFSIGSGSQEQLTIGQAASMLPVFLGTGAGLVPVPTGGGSGAFLRDDGKWAAPTGLGNAQLAPMPAMTIKGRSGPSGFPEDLVPSAVATMLPLFNNIDKGLVPGSGGGTANFLRADGQWAGPSVAAGVSGVAFAQIQDISAPRFVGRFQGSGSMQELSPLTAASMLPRMLGSGFGLVASPTLPVSGNFLRDDGTFATVGTGVTNGQHAPFPPLTVQGRFTIGSGTAEAVTVPQMASMLPPFFASGARGVVLGPTGGVAGNFLRDDGSWQTVSAGAASGISLAQQGALPPFTFQGRTTLGSGIPEALSIGQAVSMLPRFLGTGAGLVPVPSVIGSGAFLRDDGKWASPTGLGNGQFALMPPSTIKGTPGATGLPQDLVGSAVSTLLPLFNDIDKGLVPGSAGGNTSFLRADGTWAAPSVGGSVSGIAFNQIQDLSPFTVLGRPSNSSGTTQQLTPNQVGSLLPNFFGSGTARGVVPAPTGGASGFFLRDDGTWVDLLRNEIPLGNIGSGALGSATIDFNAGAFQTLNLFGSPQFTLKPPGGTLAPSGMHRHLQLSVNVCASGRAPTFYGTAVKWAGGSAMYPSMFATSSGALYTMNFFWNGSKFLGQVGGNAQGYG